MPLDPRIPLMAGQGVRRSDPMRTYANLLGIQHAQRKNELAELEYQRKTQQRQAFQQAYDPVTGEFDEGKLRAAFAASGDPTQYLKYQETQLGLEDARTTREKNELALMQQKLQTVANVMSSATDQASWDRGLTRLKSMGMETGNISPTFDPAQRDQLANEAMTALQRMKYELDVRKTQATEERAAAATAGKMGTTVYTGNQPLPFNIPKGDMLADPSNPAAGVKPIPGSERDVKEKGRQTKATQALRRHQENTDRAVRVLTDVLGRIDAATAGAGGVLLSKIPGTGARDLQRDLETALAIIGFGELQAMRDASPTGGALGQVSEMENRLLQAVLGALQQDQSPDQLKRNIERAIMELQSGKQRLEQGYTTEFGGAVPARMGPNEQHIQFLLNNPHLAPDFDAKFGPGSAAQILGPGGGQ